MIHGYSLSCLATLTFSEVCASPLPSLSHDSGSNLTVDDADSLQVKTLSFVLSLTCVCGAFDRFPTCCCPQNLESWQLDIGRIDRPERHWFWRDSVISHGPSITSPMKRACTSPQVTSPGSHNGSPLHFAPPMTFSWPSAPKYQLRETKGNLRNIS
jgi:hypothetical protein